MFDVTPACADVTIVDRESADVCVVPQRKRVAIVGFATNTLHLVPWQDPSFEIWGMNQGYLHCARRCDRWFEIHLLEAMPDIRDPGYMDFLARCRIPIYMTQCYDQFPSSIRFPIEDAIRYGGRDYFMSSVSYMLALAGMQGFTEIHLYGINLAIGDEYFYEKPNAEWWIGVLEGKGLKVVVPTASSLLKQYKRYGYHVDARPNQNYKVLLQSRANEYRTKAEKAQAEFHMMLGAMREDEGLMQIGEGMDHGADIVLIPPTPASVAPAST